MTNRPIPHTTRIRPYALLYALLCGGVVLVGLWAGAWVWEVAVAFAVINSGMP